MMKVNGVSYSNDDVLKMVYYFQNRSFFRIVWEWTKLKFRQKVSSSEINE